VGLYLRKTCCSSTWWYAFTNRSKEWSTTQQIWLSSS